MAKIGDVELASWQVVLLIGLGIFVAVSTGLLSGAITVFGYSIMAIGSLLVGGAILLGIFYFAKDISNKI